jgi:hypothetical protein
VWGIPIVAGLRIISNQSVISLIGKARLSKGQKGWRQTTRAIGQEKKAMMNGINRKRTKRTRGILGRGIDSLRNTKFGRNNIPNHFP